MNASEVKVGTIATVKIGRNEVEVTVIEITADGWKVKSNSSGREFEAKKLERIISEPESLENNTPESTDSTGAAAPSIEEEANHSETEEEPRNPAPESGRAEKKFSLLDVAAQVLKQSGAALNCKEIIALAVEGGLWTPTGAKTPEQSLYSAMFREIKNKENSRFRKSESRKGSFEFNQ